MFAIQIAIYGHPATDVYSQLAVTYNLPTLSQLVISIEQDITWTCDASTQVYFVDNLREQNRRNTFQIRFEVRPGMHDMIDVFVSLNEDNQTVHILTIRFQPRGNRGCASKVLGWLKSAAHSGNEIDFEIQGFGEREGLRFIREHSLSAFQWHETLQRYLHVTDDIRAVKLPKNKRL